MDNLSSVKLNFVSYVDSIIKNNKVSHSYLFEIDDYEIDLVFIYNFIKMILFELSYEDVLKSNSIEFKQIDNNSFPDLYVIEPEGNWIKKSQLIDLQKEYSNKSIYGGKRIYIIKYAECLNPSSANTILKFLEEPEDNIIAFLITDNRYHILDTILSRCQIISLKENLYFDECNSECFELLKAIFAPNYFFIHYNYYLNSVLIDKNVAIDYFNRIEKILISFINYKYNNSIFRNAAIIDLLNVYSMDGIIYSLNILEDELPRLKYNVNFKLWLDSLFSKLVMGG